MSVVKTPPVNVGEARVVGLIYGSGVGNGNPFQYSCLENSMDREAWQVQSMGAAKRWS